MPVKNIAITLDEETARWARIEAAKRGTSVSKLVGQMIEERREQESERRAVLERFMAMPPKALKDADAACPSREHRYDRPELR